eukprot:jgi/Undpi1/8447/HiC_scaffold_25.g10914.m1
MADPAKHADCEERRGIADEKRLPTGSARYGQTRALERLRARDEEDEQSDEDERRVQRERRQRRAEEEEREEREEEEERQEREEEERRRAEEAWRWQMEHEERQRRELDAIAVALVCILVCQEATAERRARATKRKRLNWKRHASASVREKSFRRKYRMDEPAFNKLVEILRPVIEADEKYARLRTKSGVISVETRVAIALRFCAGGSYLDLQDVHGVSKTSCYSCFHQVVDAIIECSSKIGPMKFPTTGEELKKLAAEFEEKSDGQAITGCVGCLDGLNVKTEAPSLTDVLTVIRYFSGAKNCYSLNVQAIATAKGRFLCMSCKAPGSTHDWTAYGSSQMSGAVDNLPDGYYVLGDAAYPLSDKLLTPYPGKGLDPELDSFNFHLSQLRIKVEQAFGILVKRWGILWKPLRISFDRRPKLIRALFHLHNFCIDEGSQLIRREHEKKIDRRCRPILNIESSLPAEYQTPQPKRPRRSGEVETRRSIMLSLQRVGQGRPERNKRRNMPR